MSLWKFLLAILLLLVNNSLARKVKKEYSSYRQIPLCQPSDYFRYPENVDEVVEIVKEAIMENKTVKVFGARHSQTDIICTDGIPVENRNLKSFVYHPSNKTATLGAGVTLREATIWLREYGRAFKTTPAFGNITVAGAIGTGAHGSTIKYTSSLSAQVIGLTVVNGLGEVVYITDEEDLHAFRIHLGLLGVVVDVTFITAPLYKTRAINYVVDDKALTDGRVEEWARTTDQISVYWFPFLHQLVIANWTIVSKKTKGKAWTYDHVPSTYESASLVLSTATEKIYQLTESPCTSVSSAGYKLLSQYEDLMKSSLITDTPGFVPIYTEDGSTVKNPAVGWYDEMFAPTCREDETPDGLECPWAHGKVGSNLTLLDNEVGFSMEDLPDVIFAIKKIIAQTPTLFPLQGILLRFSAASDTYMSSAYGRDTVHFEWYTWLRKSGKQNPPASLAGYQAIMQLLVKQFNGRPHWGKNGMIYHSQKILDGKLDPEAKAKFLDAMDKHDPNGLFLNNFGRRLKGTSSKMDLDPNIKRCGLIDNCFCKRDTDCGKWQTCTALKAFPSFPVCKTQNEQSNGVGSAPSKTSSSSSGTLAFFKSLPKGIPTGLQCAGPVSQNLGVGR